MAATVHRRTSREITIEEATYQCAWSADGNYSARPILASDNQEAARRLGQFHETKRIVDDVDRFHVRITS